MTRQEFEEFRLVQELHLYNNHLQVYLRLIWEQFHSLLGESWTETHTKLNQLQTAALLYRTSGNCSEISYLLRFLPIGCVV